MDMETHKELCEGLTSALAASRAAAAAELFELALHHLPLDRVPEANRTLLALRATVKLLESKTKNLEDLLQLAREAQRQHRKATTASPRGDQ